MASIISVDNIRATGTSTNAITIDSSNNLGDITMNAEGGTNTLSVRQGVAKAWANISGSNSPVVDDSLNVSSLTDGGDGIVSYNWTNAMNNSNYACLHGMMRDTNTNGNRGASGVQIQSVTTALLKVTQMYGASSNTDGGATGGGAHDSAAITGDLA